MKSSNKSILITGVCGGMGSVIAEIFLKNNYYVFGLGTKNNPPAKLKNYNNFSYSSVDITDFLKLSKYFQSLKNKKISLIVNCAGILLLKNSQNVSISEWKSTIDINLTGSFNISKAGSSYFIEKKIKGMIILIGSRWGTSGSEKDCSYAASKSGLKGLVKSLQQENYKTGIRFILISPGSVLTGMSRSVDKNVGENILKPKDIAELILYLSKVSSNVIFDEISIKAFPYDFIN